MARELQVAAGKSGYTVHIRKGLLGSTARYLRQLGMRGRVFIITDSVVDDLYGDMLLYGLLKEGFTARRYVAAAGEGSKSLAQAEKIYGAMAAFNLTRDGVVLTLGGGVVGDLGGFSAATYMRGVPFIQIPTTLLAQVDSSVGGKVAVNMPQGKNLVGLFYQPAAVLIDPLLLNTLSDRNFRDGMAEVIKYGCIRDEEFLSLLERMDGRGQVMDAIEDIIFRCCDIKREFVERDERDGGDRMLLNFGHTLGHAIESVSGYGYTHGEGVAMGMRAIAGLGEGVGITQPGTSQRIAQLLSRFGLPSELPDLDGAELGSVIRSDKKNGSEGLRLVLLRRAGEAFLHRADLHFFDRLRQCA